MPMDFNMLLRPGVVNAFSTGMQQGQQQAMDQRRMALQEQQAARQAQMSQLQLAKFQRDEAAIQQMQKRMQAAGQTGDLGQVFKAMMESGDPNLVTKGVEGMQKWREHESFKAYLQRQKQAPLTAGVPGPQTPSEQRAPYQAAAPQGDQKTQNFLAADRQSPVANGLAPEYAAKKQRLEQLERERNELTQFANVPAAVARAKDITEQIRVLRDEIKPHYVTRDLGTHIETVDAVSNRVLSRAPKSKSASNSPAPTLTQIQDPTNPDRMITIDARVYKGGGLGAPGVIGSSGKTAPVAAAEQKKVAGQSQALDILDSLGAAYDELDRRRAIPSEQRNAISNLLSSLASSGVGQAAGRAVGTAEQTQRDIINSSRNQLLNAVKNATGMSAQQLNSNVEFRSWLEALTDPGRSIESNRKIIENMRNFIEGKRGAKKRDGASLSPIDQQALDWANANPSDPRAAEIKQRLGR